MGTKFIGALRGATLGVAGIEVSVVFFEHFFLAHSKILRPVGEMKRFIRKIGLS